MERAREGVTILLNDVWHSVVIDFGLSSSSQGLKFVWWRGITPMKEFMKKGRGSRRVGNGYRLCMVGDLNGWIGDRVRASITGGFGVPGENDKGRRVVEFFAERGLCVDNTYFEHKNFHKYTRVARFQDEVEIKSMIDLVLVKKDICILCRM